MTDRAGGTTVSDPFAALGLPARAGLSDDDVRAAWRRIAAATHPDREDGGEPARFGAAAAAYALLRTAYGRGEALADLGAGGGSAAPRPRWRPGAWLKLWSRVRRVRNAGREFGPGARAHPRHGEAGRHGGGTRIFGTGAGPGGTVGRTGARVAIAGAVASAAFLAAGWAPSSIGVLAGVLTWLLVTSTRATGRRQ